MSCGALAAPPCPLAPSKGSWPSLDRASIGKQHLGAGKQAEAALKRGDRASRRGRGRERRIAPRAVQPSPPCIEYVQVSSISIVSISEQALYEQCITMLPCNDALVNGPLICSWLRRQS